MSKNVLVIAGNSQIATEAIKLLLNNDFRIYATSRKEFNLEHNNLHKYNLDITLESSFKELSDKLKNIEFCAIVNNAGCVVASPVEFLDEDELQRQLDVNLFGLLRVIKYFSSNLEKDGKMINVSSMASYGVYPFLSPYCLSKAAADILLRAYSNESGFKYVSIRPGAIRTKFWTDSIEQNQDNFKNFMGKYERIGHYMLDNAKKNSKDALEPIFVGRAIYKAIVCKNPPSVINAGFDALLCAFASKFLSESLVNKVVRKALKLKSK